MIIGKLNPITRTVTPMIQLTIHCEVVGAKDLLDAQERAIMALQDALGACQKSLEAQGVHPQAITSQNVMANA